MRRRRGEHSHVVAGVGDGEGAFAERLPKVALQCTCSKEDRALVGFSED